MRLKYYLRGIGLGIIFATIVMTVSISVHNNYLSQEKIIQEARKLGMIMPGEESQKEGLQFQEEESQSTQQKENSQQEGESLQQETENQVLSQNQQNTQKEDVEIILERDTYVSSYGGKVMIRKSPNRPTREIIMTIERGATSEDVAEVLYQCGYIESRAEFNQYMLDNGYNVIVLTGEKIIEAGSTHEEIAHILLTKYEEE